MYVCLCKGVTDRQIRHHASAAGEPVRLRDLRLEFGLGQECGQCCSHALEVLRGVKPAPAGCAHEGQCGSCTQGRAAAEAVKILPLPAPAPASTPAPLRMGRSMRMRLDPGAMATA